MTWTGESQQLIRAEVEGSEVGSNSEASATGGVFEDCTHANRCVYGWHHLGEGSRAVDYRSSLKGWDVSVAIGRNTAL